MASNVSTSNATEERRPGALADLQLNAILAADQGTSSEDEVPELLKIPAEDARGAIGVSIGQQQTRFTSPKTPATEKAAAIEEASGFFGDRTTETELEDVAEDEGAEDEGAEDEGAEDEGTDVTPPSAERRSEPIIATEPVRPVIPGPGPRQTQVRLPSPWRSEHKRTDKAKAILRDGLMFNRRRASSGPDSGDSAMQNWQRAFMASLPSLPKNFSLSSSLSSFNSPQDRPSSPATSTHHLVAPNTQYSSLSRSVSPREQDEAEAKVGELPGKPDLQKTRTRPSQLRRSASDTSLTTHRTMSRVSSLGDDSRWEDVHEQVNSRLKAIKDSWQDSNIRMPSLPSIANFRAADFLRDRSSSISRKNSEPEQPVDPMTRQPYHSAKQAITDGKPSAHHPEFNRTLERLQGDIVVLGGYRGSVLRSAEPPHRQVWVPIKVGLNIRKVDLEVGLEEDADEQATKKIIPGGMLTHIGPVDISRRLFKRLRASEAARSGQLRVHDYGYDWRLHPTYLSNQLIRYLESLLCNDPKTPMHQRGATVVAHSLGGLITRHAVNQRPELFRGVVYAGVPDTCVNILGPLRNGDEVLLSSRVLTAQVNLTIRTSFALLPLDGRCFFDINTREEYPVDFFDPQTWIDYRLSPCIARPLPPLTAQPKPTGLTGYVSSMASALPNLPMSGRKASISRSKDVTTISGTAEPDTMTTNDPDTPGTTVTIPPQASLAYLHRLLPTIRKFKQDTAHNPAITNYPPVAVIYGKSTPTVYGARVAGREGIKHADAYDNLAFASGDGVVLAKAAMLPPGYKVARGGLISSERGHVTLLGDLEAVGRALGALIDARGRGR